MDYYIAPLIYPHRPRKYRTISYYTNRQYLRIFQINVMDVPLTKHPHFNMHYN